MEDNNKTIKNMDLFPFFREFFNSTGDWDKIDDSVKIKHTFMLKRYLSIKYPQIIQMVNGVTYPSLIDALHFMMAKPNGQSPSFMYAKANQNKNVDTKEFLNKYDKITINKTKELFDLNDRDLEYVIKYHKEYLISFMDDFQKNLKNNISKNNSRRKKGAN